MTASKTINCTPLYRSDGFKPYQSGRHLAITPGSQTRGDMTHQAKPPLAKFGPANPNGFSRQRGRSNATLSAKTMTCCHVELKQLERLQDPVLQSSEEHFAPQRGATLTAKEITRKRAQFSKFVFGVASRMPTGLSLHEQICASVVHLCSLRERTVFLRGVF